MSKFLYSNMIEKDTKDIRYLHSNLNDLRIRADAEGVEESKETPENSDNSVDNRDDLADVENGDIDVENSYQIGGFTTSENESKWIGVEMESLEKFLSGDAITSIEDKLDETISNFLPVDILDAEELQKKHPNFPPEFYSYFEKESRKKFY